MVEITLLELNLPNAEAEFNAPFAGRGRSYDDGEETVPEATPAAGGPSPESVVAVLVGLLSVAALVWLRSRGAGDDEDSEADD